MFQLCKTIKKENECIFMTKSGCSAGGCKPIVEQCIGCKNVEKWLDKEYCIAYISPESKWTAAPNYPCPRSTHVVIRKVVEEKMVDPLKASRKLAKTIAKAKKKG